jgi:hypothetical protein
VCELIAERAALSEQLNSYSPTLSQSADDQSGCTATEDPFARIRRTWVEYCESRGWRQ